MWAAAAHDVAVFVARHGRFGVAVDDVKHFMVPDPEAGAPATPPLQWYLPKSSPVTFPSDESELLAAARRAQLLAFDPAAATTSSITTRKAAGAFSSSSSLQAVFRDVLAATPPLLTAVHLDDAGQQKRAAAISAFEALVALNPRSGNGSSNPLVIPPSASALPSFNLEQAGRAATSIEVENAIEAACSCAHCAARRSFAPGRGGAPGIYFVPTVAALTLLLGVPPPVSALGQGSLDLVIASGPQGISRVALGRIVGAELASRWSKLLSRMGGLIVRAVLATGDANANSSCLRFFVPMRDPQLLRPAPAAGPARALLPFIPPCDVAAALLPLLTPEPGATTQQLPQVSLLRLQSVVPMLAAYNETGIVDVLKDLGVDVSAPQRGRARVMQLHPEAAPAAVSDDAGTLGGDSHATTGDIMWSWQSSGNAAQSPAPATASLVLPTPTVVGMKTAQLRTLAAARGAASFDVTERVDTPQDSGADSDVDGARAAVRVDVWDADAVALNMDAAAGPQVRALLDWGVGLAGAPNVHDKAGLVRLRSRDDASFVVNPVALAVAAAAPKLKENKQQRGPEAADGVVVGAAGDAEGTAPTGRSLFATTIAAALNSQRDVDAVSMTTVVAALDGDGASTPTPGAVTTLSAARRAFPPALHHRADAATRQLAQASSAAFGGVGEPSGAAAPDLVVLDLPAEVLRAAVQRLQGLQVAAAEGSAATDAINANLPAAWREVGGISGLSARYFVPRCNVERRIPSAQRFVVLASQFTLTRTTAPTGASAAGEVTSVECDDRNVSISVRGATKDAVVRFCVPLLYFALAEIRSHLLERAAAATAAAGRGRAPTVARPPGGPQPDSASASEDETAAAAASAGAPNDNAHLVRRNVLKRRALAAAADTCLDVVAGQAAGSTRGDSIGPWMMARPFGAAVPTLVALWDVALRRALATASDPGAAAPPEAADAAPWLHFHVADAVRELPLSAVVALGLCAPRCGVDAALLELNRDRASEDAARLVDGRQLDADGDASAIDGRVTAAVVAARLAMTPADWGTPLAQLRPEVADLYFGDSAATRQRVVVGVKAALAAVLAPKGFVALGSDDDTFALRLAPDPTQPICDAATLAQVVSGGETTAARNLVFARLLQAVNAAALRDMMPGTAAAMEPPNMAPARTLLRERPLELMSVEGDTSLGARNPRRLCVLRCAIAAGAALDAAASAGKFLPSGQRAIVMPTMRGLFTVLRLCGGQLVQRVALVADEVQRRHFLLRLVPTGTAAAREDLRRMLHCSGLDATIAPAHRIVDAVIAGAAVAGARTAGTIQHHVVPMPVIARAAAEEAVRAIARDTAAAASILDSTTPAANLKPRVILTELSRLGIRSRDSGLAPVQKSQATAAALSDMRSVLGLDGGNLLEAVAASQDAPVTDAAVRNGHKVFRRRRKFSTGANNGNGTDDSEASGSGSGDDEDQEEDGPSNNNKGSINSAAAKIRRRLGVELGPETTLSVIVTIETAWRAGVAAGIDPELLKARCRTLLALRCGATAETADGTDGQVVAPMAAPTHAIDVHPVEAAAAAATEITTPTVADACSRLISVLLSDLRHYSKRDAAALLHDVPEETLSAALAHLVATGIVAMCDPAASARLGGYKLRRAALAAFDVCRLGSDAPHRIARAAAAPTFPLDMTRSGAHAGAAAESLSVAVSSLLGNAAPVTQPAGGIADRHVTHHLWPVVARAEAVVRAAGATSSSESDRDGNNDDDARRRGRSDSDNDEDGNPRQAKYKYLLDTAGSTVTRRAEFVLNGLTCHADAALSRPQPPTPPAPSTAAAADAQVFVSAGAEMEESTVAGNDAAVQASLRGVNRKMLPHRMPFALAFLASVSRGHSSALVRAVATLAGRDAVGAAATTVSELQSTHVTGSPSHLRVLICTRPTLTAAVPTPATYTAVLHAPAYGALLNVDGTLNYTALVLALAVVQDVVAECPVCSWRRIAARLRCPELLRPDEVDFVLALAVAGGLARADSSTAWSAAPTCASVYNLMGAIHCTYQR